MLGRDWNVFVLSELSDGAVRKAMESGQFYFSTVSSHESDARDVSRTPAIEAIIHDVAAGTIAISAVSEREPVDDQAYRWISAGEVVHVVPTLDYRKTEGIDSYVRAEVTGAGGTAFTNPFGFTRP